MIRWAGRAVVGFLALLGAWALADVLRAYWPQFVQQVELATFEAEQGDSPFLRP